MPKLKYWVAECERDSKCYSLRAKTKKEVVTMLATTYDPADYGPVKKVEIEYRDAFDLMSECLNEGGGYWES